MSAKNYGNLGYIPERAIVVTGDSATAGHHENIAILYSREGMSFDEPGAPRFLFLDRQGKVALGIGGYVKGVGMYDVDGAIDGTGFATYDIPVPFDPAQRQRFGADASQSTVFLKMVARNDKLGLITVYLQTGFNSASKGYTMKLKQAYVSVGHVTAGLARSTFADGEAQAPTIDSEGPSGEISAKNMLFQYKTKSYKGFSGAISIENPSATYSTIDGQSEAIAQRVPDIPLYVQYAWTSDSHVRLSLIHRSLSYRDMLTEKNHLKSGWGIHLSSVGDIMGGFGYFGHIAY
ncbi:MAG: porin, partial [Muribaculaceae bacterium]|nr:porin [Muribaculaceae bacterium]